MTIVLNPTGLVAEDWRQTLARHAPQEKFELISEVTDPAEVELLLGMRAPRPEEVRFPNLRCAVKLGHGVDEFLRLGSIPENVPIIRLVDETITEQVATYAIAATLRFHCQMEAYDEFKRERRWHPLNVRRPDETTVCVLGLGPIGRNIAGKLRNLGFRVIGWSRSPKDIPGLRTEAGRDALYAVAGESDVLLAILPLTPETHRILDERLFGAARRGAYLINVGRGPLLDNEHLIAALGAGQIGGAYLDVFDPEPLPRDHPFWAHPRVSMTPHASSDIRPDSCIPQVLENLANLRQGRPLLNVVDRRRGW